MFVFSTRLKSWSEELSSNHEWQGQLNSIFDSIGFTETYVDRCVAWGQRPSGREKAIKDNIWGMIEFSPVEAALIDSPIIQRLRSIRQNGFTYLTYPSATHTRFEHTLGVYEVVNRLLDSFEKTKSKQKKEKLRGQKHSESVACKSYDSDSREFRLIKHAALLHDIGHCAFSHASEKAFSIFSDSMRIGPYRIDDFLNSFRKKYSLVAPGEPQPSEKPNLSEVLSVALISSRRFKRFYDGICAREPDARSHDVYDISSLVLGDRIEQNDFALPQVLSGPVDADKIDYMLRDAQACGLGTGIDVARAFLRAGVYEIPPEEASRLNLQAFDQTRPTRIFVIDESGTDAVRELGSSRLSLYQRVYYHPFTRKVEEKFTRVVERFPVTTCIRAKSYKDYLEVWKSPEDVIFWDLSHSTDDLIAVGATKIRNRDLPKRIAVFFSDHFIPQHVPASELRDALQSWHQELAEQLVRPIKNESEIYSRDFEERVSRVSEKLKRILQNSDAYGDKENLPTSAAPQDIYTVTPSSKNDFDPKPAIIISNDRAERYGEKLSSYLDAGEFDFKKGMMVCDPEWREIAYLALELALFESSISSNREVDILDQSGGDDAQLRSLTLEGIYIPRLDQAQILRKCKMNAEWLSGMRQALKQENVFDQAPELISYSSKKVDEIAQRFRTFQGELGWKITKDHVQTFIEQFPPSLRNEVENLLIEKFHYLDREEYVSATREAISMAPSGLESMIGPLSPSSGAILRTHLKDSLNPDITRRADPISAAQDAIVENKPLVLIDDNIASGTQASRQLRGLFGIEAVKKDGNYFSGEFSDDVKQHIRKTGLTICFACGTTTGKQNLLGCLTDLGVSQSLTKIVIKESLDDRPVLETMSNELKEFLERVGYDLMLRRSRIEGSEDAEAARKAALGYSGMANAYVTSFNVPTTTFPAFWCPGTTFGKSLLDSTSKFERPWIPLFIRSGHFKYFVSGL